MRNKTGINRVLGRLGLAQLEDPAGLLSQFGFLVRDHEHLQSLLTTCEPEHRRAMYDSLKPNLRFQAKPLEDYMIAAASQAEREQLPEWDQENQKFKAFRSPELESAEYIEGLLAETVAKQFLTLVCKKCTREESFSGLTKADAVQQARDAGWVYSALGEGIEICPACPAVRMAA